MVASLGKALFTKEVMFRLLFPFSILFLSLWLFLLWPQAGHECGMEESPILVGSIFALVRMEFATDSDSNHQRWQQPRIGSEVRLPSQLADKITAPEIVSAASDNSLDFRLHLDLALMEQGNTSITCHRFRTMYPPQSLVTTSSYHEMVPSRHQLVRQTNKQTNLFVLLAFPQRQVQQPEDLRTLIPL
jgi:hypothetical protein